MGKKQIFLGFMNGKPLYKTTCECYGGCDAYDFQPSTDDDISQSFDDVFQTITCPRCGKRFMQIKELKIMIPVVECSNCKKTTL